MVSDLTDQRQSTFNERGTAAQSEKSPVQGYLAALAIVLLLGMVLTRAVLMSRTGTRALHFGNLEKTDFLIRRLRFSISIPSLLPLSICPSSAPKNSPSRSRGLGRRSLCFGVCCIT